MSLNNALQVNGHGYEAAAENLYLARVAQPDDGPAQLGLKKFFDIMPNLKASDFDYIIFDMPPVSQISLTPRLARFMDMVLVVVESEKTDSEIAKRACFLLEESKANVGVVLNKARTYVPKRLQQEL